MVAFVKEGVFVKHAGAGPDSSCPVDLMPRKLPASGIQQGLGLDRSVAECYDPFISDVVPVATGCAPMSLV